MKFKVGDKVRVRSDIEVDKMYGRDKFIDEMYKYKNKILTISCVGEEWYAVKENLFNWTDEMLIKVGYTYEDLKKSPLGTKITFEDGEVLVKNEENRFENVSRCRDIANLYNLKDDYNVSGKIIKIEEPEYKTVYEAKVEILDEAEKRYLRGVIRPFRDRVEAIEKKQGVRDDGEYKSFISISIDYDTDIMLPYFDTDTMYNGMKANQKYTLEELGL